MVPEPRPLVLSTSPTFGIIRRGPAERLMAAGLRVEIVDQDDAASIDTLLPEASAWIVGFRAVTSAALDAAPNLRILVKPGAGTDNIDLAAAAARDIAVASTPGLNRDAVAEFVIAALLSLVRQLPTADTAVRAGRWPRIVTREISGRTLGLVGLGSIGLAVAARARALGLGVVAYDVRPPGMEAQGLGVTMADVATVLAESDFVSIHVPLTPATSRLIGPAELARMKRGAYLINTSRGGIVDEVALAAALDEGHLAGAAIDVFEHEPIEPTNPLLRSERVVLSPHSAGYTEEALDRIGAACVEAILGALHR